MVDDISTIRRNAGMADGSFAHEHPPARSIKNNQFIAGEVGQRPVLGDAQLAHRLRFVGDLDEAAAIGVEAHDLTVLDHIGRGREGNGRDRRR